MRDSPLMVRACRTRRPRSVRKRDFRSHHAAHGAVRFPASLKAESLPCISAASRINRVPRSRIEQKTARISARRPAYPALRSVLRRLCPAAAIRHRNEPGRSNHAAGVAPMCCGTPRWSSLGHDPYVGSWAATQSASGRTAAAAAATPPAGPPLYGRTGRRAPWPGGGQPLKAGGAAERHFDRLGAGSARRGRGHRGRCGRGETGAVPRSAPGRRPPPRGHCRGQRAGAAGAGPPRPGLAPEPRSPKGARRPRRLDGQARELDRRARRAPLAARRQGHLDRLGRRRRHRSGARRVGQGRTRRPALRSAAPPPNRLARALADAATGATTEATSWRCPGAWRRSNSRGCSTGRLD